MRRGGPALLLALATLVLQGSAGCARKPVEHVLSPAGPWTPLFNGKDLDGWLVKIAKHPLGDNYRNTFRVEDGLLKVSYAQYEHFDGRFGSLIYKAPFERYWIRVEYRFKGRAAPGAPSWAFKNSGLQLHGQSPQSMRLEQEFPVSVEFDLVGGRWIGSRPTGDVCRNGTQLKIGGQPLREKCSKVSDITVRDDRWVVAEAEVDGSRRVRQIVDGALVVEYTDLALDPASADARQLQSAAASGALGSGYISIQSNGAPIEFRRIEIYVPPESPPR